MNSSDEKRKVIVSVSNDLIADQRLNKICSSLLKSGFDVLIVGRELKNSLPFTSDNISHKRFRLLFNKGPLFYACFNFRLFLFLLTHKADLLYSNDLDTLLPNYLVSRIRHRRMIYDSHEYFTEVPELVDRPRVQKIWKRIEKSIFPQLKHVITVAESIANIYREKYSVDVQVMRNLPLTPKIDLLNYQPEAMIVLYQGALNKGRGLERLIESFQFIENKKLWIVGGGDVELELHQLVDRLKISDRVHFYGKIPYQELKNITEKVSLGVSLEENIGLNYYYALPNKLFDYIHSGIPVLVSPFPEMKRIVEEYKVGILDNTNDSKQLAQLIQATLDDKKGLMDYHTKCVDARNSLTWENEEKVLLGMLKQLFE